MKLLLLLPTFIFLATEGLAQTPLVKYYDNGKIASRGFVKGDRYDSTFISYYENGNKASEGIFKNCSYRTSSIAIVRAPFCDVGANATKPLKGIKNGEWKCYYANGAVKNIENFHCGINVGQELVYDSAGRLLERAFYNAGTLIQLQEYYPGGTLKMSTTRVEEIDDKGRKTNAFKENISEYYETGILRCLKTVNEAGLPTGRYVEYWANGFVKMEGNYRAGKKEGVFREYYENGNTRFEGIIKNNIPQNQQYFLNDKGTVTKVETWKKGKLVKTEDKSGS
ncbi:toxin-antitoxin system YwqK family antitoxin [Niabella sp. 22666]|uniref:toxin-antitoxin system YwqK family antitoxin n=1 Tax=Niabella sp. 22666 TaxID=3453954 RepID=UPI003F83A65B